MRCASCSHTNFAGWPIPLTYGPTYHVGMRETKKGYATIETLNFKPLSLFFLFLHSTDTVSQPSRESCTGHTPLNPLGSFSLSICMPLISATRRPMHMAMPYLPSRCRALSYHIFFMPRRRREPRLPNNQVYPPLSQSSLPPVVLGPIPIAPKFSTKSTRLGRGIEDRIG